MTTVRLWGGEVNLTGLYVFVTYAVVGFIFLTFAKLPE
jgi:hypothetical protein